MGMSYPRVVLSLNILLVVLVVFLPIYVWMKDGFWFNGKRRLGELIYVYFLMFIAIYMKWM